MRRVSSGSETGSLGLSVVSELDRVRAIWSRRAVVGHRPGGGMPYRTASRHGTSPGYARHVDDTSRPGYRGRAVVPDLRGMLVSEARLHGEQAGLVVVSQDPDGPPLGALTWPGVWFVVSQDPPPGEQVARGSSVRITFGRQNGGGAGVREPRRPPPDRGEHAVEAV